MKTNENARELTGHQDFRAERLLGIFNFVCEIIIQDKDTKSLHVNHALFRITDKYGQM